MFLILENKRKNDSTAILEGNLRINRLYLNKIATKITLCEFFYKFWPQGEGKGDIQVSDLRFMRCGP